MERRKGLARAVIGITGQWNEGKQRCFVSSEFLRAVDAAGGEPAILALVPSAVGKSAARMDAFILSGNASDIDPARYGQPRHPQVKTIQQDRDETDWRVLEHVYRTGKPVLGICFGMQSLNVYRGGTLVQHIAEQLPGALDHENRQLDHAIALEPGSRLAEWTGGIRELRVNSTHHQAPDKIGTGLRVAARAPDGVIEAIEAESSDHFVIGVEWHPERVWETEPFAARIFRELVLAAARKLPNEKSKRPAGTRSIVEKAR
jgi:putative glutamine amidotransferase